MDDSPIVRRFSIHALHGYKDVQIAFDSRSRIIIAENGSGKTTILGALASFLKGHFYELQKLRFERIECELNGQPEPVVLLHDHLMPAGGQSLATLREWSRISGRSLSELQTALLADADTTTPFGSGVLHEVYSRSPHDRQTFQQQVNELRGLVREQTSAPALKAMDAVRRVMSNYQILSLPTYRRVELPKVRDRRAQALELERRRYTRGLSEEPGRTAADSIQFGLADVEERLQALMVEIQRQSNIGYRKITATIIDDALSGGLRAESLFPQGLPTVEDLGLFFSRVEETFSTKRRLEQLEELYANGSINSTDNVLLRYFLGKFAEVMSKTREMESRVEAFVERANTYLAQSTDEKQLQYSANTMKVAVFDKWTNSNIDFDSLSSGEKQVLSLMAHMYLGTRKKIVLIDEPELSLSIEWQRRILPDIADAPTCAQLLAITHSPFIFENKLDPLHH